MTQRAIAAAVAGQLVNHAADLDGHLIDVDLPRVAEVFTRQLCTMKDRRQRAHIQRSGGMIGRDIVGRIRPLRIAGHGDSKDCQAQNPTGFLPIRYHRYPRSPHCRSNWAEIKSGKILLTNASPVASVVRSNNNRILLDQWASRPYSSANSQRRGLKRLSTVMRTNDHSIPCSLILLSLI